MLTELQQRGGAEAMDAGQDPLGPAATGALLELFAERGWAGPSDTRPSVNAAAQHGSFFREMEDAVVAYFDGLPLDAQPTHIADLGCGDGTLLKRLHAAVVTRTRRGAALAQHPLTLIAADYNEASLEAARHGLAALPHLAVQADIGNPAAFVASLANRGVDSDGVLHVRSFVDHDRPLLPPRDPAATARRRGFGDTGVHVDDAGGAVASADAVQSLAEHMARWRDVVAGHGLLVLEVHCVRPATVRRLHHQTEALHFDAYHAFARQHLVEAPTFLLLSAEAGLVPSSRDALRFPRPRALHPHHAAPFRAQTVPHPPCCGGRHTCLARARGRHPAQLL